MKPLYVVICRIDPNQDEDDLRVQIVGWTDNREEAQQKADLFHQGADAGDEYIVEEIHRLG